MGCGSVARTSRGVSWTGLGCIWPSSIGTPTTEADTYTTELPPTSQCVFSARSAEAQLFHSAELNEWYHATTGLRWSEPAAAHSPATAAAATAEDTTALPANNQPPNVPRRTAGANRCPSTAALQPVRHTDEYATSARSAYAAWRSELWSPYSGPK